MWGLSLALPRFVGRWKMRHQRGKNAADNVSPCCPRVCYDCDAGSSRAERRGVFLPASGRPSTSVSAIEREYSMQISVSVRHGEMQPGDQPLIEEKVEKLRRLFDR